MTMTRIESMRGINSKLSELKASTSELSLNEKRVLLESLTAEIQAAAVGGPTKRLAAVSAAATSTNPRTQGAFKTAVRLLKRLGSELDAVCATGDISALDKKARELKWAPEQRTQLKLVLSIIGAIA
jgi:hypothetical protein